MTFSIHITAKALDEIDEALAWYVEQSIPAATRWHVKLMAAVRSLEENLERWGLAPESEWYPGIRQLIYGKKRGAYRILFEIRGDTVYILRVRHSARELFGPRDL